MSHKINQITEDLVRIRDRGVRSNGDRDALAEAANRLQGFAAQWENIFAEFHGGDDLSGDGFIDLTAEQIEACMSLTQ